MVEYDLSLTNEQTIMNWNLSLNYTFRNSFSVRFNIDNQGRNI
jgi:hypothetical protein